MKMCKEVGCTNRVESVADKSYDSVIWKGDKMLNVFFPSVVADHGRCYYHARKHENAEWFAEGEAVREKIREKNRYKTLQLFKLGGSDNGYARVDI